MGVGRGGGRGGQAPLDFENFSKKRLFFQFRGVKIKFHFPPLEKSFRRPWLRKVTHWVKYPTFRLRGGHSAAELIAAIVSFSGKFKSCWWIVCPSFFVNQVLFFEDWRQLLRIIVHRKSLLWIVQKSRQWNGGLVTVSIELYCFYYCKYRVILFLF